MPPLVREYPVLMTFEFLLLGAFLWALYMGLRAEWRYRIGGYPRMSIGRGQAGWRDFSLAWVVVMGYAAPLVALADLPSRTATLLHTWNGLTVFYLVFVSGPGRNWVLRIAAHVRNLEK